MLLGFHFWVWMLLRKPPRVPASLAANAAGDLETLRNTFTTFTTHSTQLVGVRRLEYNLWTYNLWYARSQPHTGKLMLRTFTFTGSVTAFCKKQALQQTDTCIQTNGRLLEGIDRQDVWSFV